jgi:hypothetical protein
LFSGCQSFEQISRESKRRAFGIIASRVVCIFAEKKRATLKKLKPNVTNLSQSA